MCSKRLSVATLSLALFVSLPNSTRSDTIITLKPSADTALFELNPDLNLGGGTDMPAGSTAETNRSRALIRFNLSQIPANATVSSASLTVTVDKVPSSGVGSVFGLYRVLKNWGEGTGVANGSAA